MTREDLINQIVEEIKIGSELGNEYRHTAQNIVALMEGNRKHLDYNWHSGRYEWEEE